MADERSNAARKAWNTRKSPKYKADKTERASKDALSTSDSDSVARAHLCTNLAILRSAEARLHTQAGKEGVDQAAFLRATTPVDRDLNDLASNANCVSISLADLF